MFFGFIGFVALTAILWGDRQHLLQQTQYTQPCLYCYQFALAKLWISLGVQPSVMLGHSVGEYAAAAIAGVFSSEEGLRLIYARGSLMVQYCKTGKMLAVFAEMSQLQSRIEFFDELSVAAINAPNQLVVSGDDSQMQKLAQKLEKLSIRFVHLTVSHGFHSKTMDPMLEPFKVHAHTISYQKPNIAMISTVNDYRGECPFTEAEYWVFHVRSGVNFLKALKESHLLSINTYIEIGAQPILTRLAEQILSQNGAICRYFSSDKAGDQSLSCFHQALAYCYSQGISIQWQFAFNRVGRWLDFPIYPFALHHYPVLSLSNTKQIPKQEMIDLSGEQYQVLKQHTILGQPVLAAGFYLAYAIESFHRSNEQHVLVFEGCTIEKK